MGEKGGRGDGGIRECYRGFCSNTCGKAGNRPVERNEQKVLLQKSFHSNALFRSPIRKGQKLPLNSGRKKQRVSIPCFINKRRNCRLVVQIGNNDIGIERHTLKADAISIPSALSLHASLMRGIASHLGLDPVLLSSLKGLLHGSYQAGTAIPMSSFCFLAPCSYIQDNMK